MADRPFDEFWKSQAVEDAFASVFGRDGGLQYKPDGEDEYAIEATPVDAQPVNRLAPSDNLEYQEWRWRISSVSNTRGRVDPKILGFNGQRADTVLNLAGKTWYVVYRDAGNDPGSWVITLRDKAIPFDYDNE